MPGGNPVFRKCASGIRSGLACVLGLATLIWAAPAGAAHNLSAGTTPRYAVTPQASALGSLPAQQPSRYRIPRTVFFNEVSGRGLLVKLWINGLGPYTFVLDTGAGASIVSARVAA